MMFSAKIKQRIGAVVMVSMLLMFLLPAAACNRNGVVSPKVELTVAQVTAISALVAEKTAEAYDLLYQNGTGYVTPAQREASFKTLRIVERDGRVLVDKLTAGVQLNPTDLLALSDYLDSSAMAFAGLAALNLSPEVKAKVQTIAEWVTRATSAARILIVAMLPANGTRSGQSVDVERVRVTIGELDVNALKADSRGDINAAITGLTQLITNAGLQIAVLVKADVDTVKQKREASLNALDARLTVAGY